MPTLPRDRNKDRLVHITADRLIYDTAKSEKLGQATGKARRGSAAQIRDRTWTETLYQTPKGRLFLACRGGRRSRHRKGDGDAARAGQHIEPYTQAQALQWCLDKGKKDLFAKLITEG
uniref:Uncharacterized protein n=1 Tax=viral metagenome TaxID=1070528 RepID=A0A6M3JNK3_9ZZZZ